MYIFSKALTLILFVHNSQRRGSGSVSVSCIEEEVTKTVAQLAKRFVTERKLPNVTRNMSPYWELKAANHHQQ